MSQFPIRSLDGNNKAAKTHLRCRMTCQVAELIYELDAPLSAPRERSAIDNKLIFALVCRAPVHSYVMY
jgi:hypothetical protein